LFEIISFWVHFVTMVISDFSNQRKITDFLYTRQDLFEKICGGFISESKICGRKTSFPIETAENIKNGSQAYC